MLRQRVLESADRLRFLHSLQLETLSYCTCLFIGAFHMILFTPMSTMYNCLNKKGIKFRVGYGHKNSFECHTLKASVPERNPCNAKYNSRAVVLT